MSIVGNIASPTLQQSGGLIRHIPTAGISDLAQSTQNTANNARVIPASQVGTIQETSRDPRTTPPALVERTTQESHAGQFTPKPDQVKISEEARIARSPEPVQTGESVAGLNLENKIDIQA
jgi:hypothetical protein